MIRDELKSQFSLFVFSHDEQSLALIKAELVQASYECFVFNDQETMLSRVAEAKPHIVIADVDTLEGTLSDFVESVAGQNEETQFILLAQDSQRKALRDYREYNVFLVFPGVTNRAF